MSTENLERISNWHGSTARTGGELEATWTERRPMELAEATERYAEESAAARDEVEIRTFRASAVQDLNSASAGGVTLYNPDSIVVSPTELCTVDVAYPLELSAGDAVIDRYREMEKRVEEQDRTIAELKGIIENLQDIVYRQKLDKETETLVL